MEVDNSQFWLMQMNILDGENSEESFKDMIFDDDNNRSDIQYYSSSDVNTSKVNNVGDQFIERMSISNTNVAPKLFSHNYNSINDNTKKNNEDVIDSPIQGEISKQNDLNLNKSNTQDDIEVANSDYLDENKSLKVQCSHCNNFFSKKFIKEHMRRSLNIQCSYCKKYITKKYSDQHMRRHRGEGRYKCDKCKKYYQSPGELKRHYLKHEKEPWRETNLKCEVCEQTFTNYSYSELLNHIQMHSDNSYKCDKCERSFSRNDLLEEHVKYSHIGKSIQKIYKCDKCEIIFKRSDLLEHIKYSHIEVPIQRISVIQKVADRTNDNPVITDKDTIGKDKFKVTLIEKVQNELKVSNSYKIPHTGTYNTVGLLISANFLSREEIRENNADEIDLGSLNLNKLLKIKKFLADTLHNKIDKTEEIRNGDEHFHKIVRAKVVDQHLILTNIDRNNSIKMERLMMEKSEESCKDMILEDDFNFILDAEIAPEIRTLISLLVLKNGFVCSYVGCLTTAKQRATLASHYMTHLGFESKPFKCDWSFCEKYFSKSSALEQHKTLIHFSESVLNQFKCISCEETFRNRINLERHIINHQELITSSSLFRREDEVGDNITPSSHFRMGNEVENNITPSSHFRMGNEVEEVAISSSNSLFRWRDGNDIEWYGMEDHTNQSEEEDEVEALPNKDEIICSHQDCHLIFSSQWKLNMHKMSDH